MKYVYILVSIADPARHYVGSTNDLRARLKAHDRGNVVHTSKFKPWRIDNFLGFSDEIRAVAFEKYLKSHSGRAFAAKRL